MSDVVTETNMENVDSVDKINRYRIITDEKDPNYAVKKVKYNDEEVLLYRIQALIDIDTNIPAGTIGGFVQSTENLSTRSYDTAWIDESSVVAGDAIVEGRALVKNMSIISNGAVIGGQCKVNHCNISKAIFKGDYDLEDVTVNADMNMQYGSGSFCHCAIVDKGAELLLTSKQIWYQNPDGRNVEFTDMRDNLHA